jgi:hypothetical protein
LIGSFLYAQEEKRVTLGINMGPSLSWISPKTAKYERDAILCGFHFGIPVDVNFTKSAYYYFHTGVKLEYSGGKLLFPYNIETAGQSFEIEELHRKYTNIYFSIPTGIKLKTPTIKGKWVIGFSFGLSHGFLLNSKKKDHYEIEQTVTDDKKKLLYEGSAFFKESVYGGIGTEYTIKENFKASFYLQYNYTLNNFFNKNAQNNISKAKESGNLNVIDFVFGISF